MKKILLFGGTGNLGRHIAREAVSRGHHVTLFVRDVNRAARTIAAHEFMEGDITIAAQLSGVCNGFDVVVSALGKSVSPNDRSKPSFEEIDLIANTTILKESLASGVKKFVYISAFHAERYPELEYFRVHHIFSERIRASGIDFSIIKPPSLFSAYLDMIPMAKKGLLFNIGKGERKTNPIYEGDVAAICIDAIETPNAVIEAGGPEIFKRNDLSQLIQSVVRPEKKVRTLPIPLLRFFLPMIKSLDRNTFDKLSFFPDFLGFLCNDLRIGFLA
jgi:uncharacterized protein YbjT (DUF2867 family)